jgi:hypothetical protein
VRKTAFGKRNRTDASSSGARRPGLQTGQLVTIALCQVFGLFQPEAAARSGPVETGECSGEKVNGHHSHAAASFAHATPKCRILALEG